MSYVRKFDTFFFNPWLIFYGSLSTINENMHCRLLELQLIIGLGY
jgi:hypothetical protein